MGRSGQQTRGSSAAIARSSDDGIAVGTRVSVLRKGGQRVWRGEAIHVDPDTVTVLFDDGKTETLHRTRAEIKPVGEQEQQERGQAIARERLGRDNIRVRLEQAPKHHTLKAAGVKRDWRGTITRIEADCRLRVKFDRAEEEIVVDPVVDRLKNITGEEIMARRRKAVEEFKPPLASGQRIELDELGSDEARLKPGMRGTITSIDGGWNVGVEWDDPTGGYLGLLPDVDRFHRIDE